MEKNEKKEEVLEKVETEEMVKTDVVKENASQEKEQEEKKGIMAWFKSHLVISIVAVVAVIALIMVIVLSLSGGPKSAVKDFTKAFSKMNAKKVVNSMDLIGADVWYVYDEEDFSKDDYKDFIKDYKEEKEDADLSEEKEDAIEELEEIFDEMKDEVKSFKIKVEEFKDVEKLGKDLYVVEAKINVTGKAKDKDEDDIDETETMTFIIYKNKVIYTDMM